MTTTKRDARFVNFLRTMALVHGRAIDRSSRPGAHRGAKRVLERAANLIETEGFDVRDAVAAQFLDKVLSDVADLDEDDVAAVDEAILIAFGMLRDGVANHPMFDAPATLEDLSSEQLHELDRQLLGFSSRRPS